MLKVKFLSLGWETTLLRYFLMMFVVIAGVLSGMYAIAFLGLPIFLSAIMGISIGREKEEAQIARTVELRAGQRKAQKVS